MKVDIEKTALPSWLSKKAQDDVLKSLDNLSNIDCLKFYGSNFHINQDFLYQGDYISNVVYSDLNGDSIPANVLIISNTCDIDLSNEKIGTRRILVAPIVTLQKFKERLNRATPSKDYEGVFNSIIKQENNSILYLPGLHNEFEDSIVFLDRIISLKYDATFKTEMLKNRKAILSDFGFYLLLIKLSVFFSRIRDGVERKPMKSE